MTVRTILHEINRNMNINVLKHFVQETTIRTELGFTVVRLGFKFLVVVIGVRKRRII